MDNVHPGDVLREDFLVGSGISLDEVSSGSGVAASRLVALMSGKIAVDADTDLRLGRFFGMSEGFFLRLQNLYDLEEAKRALNGDLDRIVPRAA